MTRRATRWQKKVWRAGKIPTTSRSQRRSVIVCSKMASSQRVQIQVSANRSTTLTGDVESVEARDRAEALAAAVAGVRYVINNLRVGQEGTTGATG